VASQSVLTHCFQGFTSAGDNLRCFRPLWHWGMGRLPGAKEGHTLDLDSTRLLHKDGNQEGVKGGYTPTAGEACQQFSEIWRKRAGSSWIIPTRTASNRLSRTRVMMTSVALS
jgi:hypothetical protein